MLFNEDDSSATNNLIDQVWSESKPQQSRSNVFEHEVKYHGRTVADNLKKIMEKAKELNCSAVLATQLDDIAWLTNLRGEDISYSPLFISYVIVFQDKGENKIVMYRDESFTEEIKSYLNKNNITIKPYEKIFEDLKSFSFMENIPEKFKIAIDSK